MRFALSLGMLSILAIILSAVLPAISAGNAVLAQEESETEPAGSAVNPAGGSAGQDDATDSLWGTMEETELESTPGLIISDPVKDAIASMSSEEFAENAQMIESLLRNPDVQELLKYEEVRDLAATLLRDAANFAVEDPDLTGKILETMGVNKNVIFVFYAVLQTIEANKEAKGDFQEFLDSEEGKKLINTLLENLDQETIDQLLVGFNEALVQQ